MDACQIGKKRELKVNQERKKCRNRFSVQPIIQMQTSQHYICSSRCVKIWLANSVRNILKFATQPRISALIMCVWMHIPLLLVISKSLQYTKMRKRDALPLPNPPKYP